MNSGSHSGSHSLSAIGTMRADEVRKILMAHMVRGWQLYGEQVAKGVGRGLIIPWPPPPTLQARIVRANR